MKVKIKTSFVLAVMLATSTMFFGCGGSSSSDTQGEETPAIPDTQGYSLSGVAVKGYLDGAEVWIDINNDGLKSSDELTSTDENGSYSLDIPADINGTRIAIVSGGTDTSTQEPFTGKLRAVFNSESNETAGNLRAVSSRAFHSMVNFTPFTNLVATSPQPNIVLRPAISNDFNKDPIAEASKEGGSSELLKTNLQIARTTELISKSSDDNSSEESVTESLVDSINDGQNLDEAIDAVAKEKITDTAKRASVTTLSNAIKNTTITQSNDPDTMKKTIDSVESATKVATSIMVEKPDAKISVDNIAEVIKETPVATGKKVDLTKLADALKNTDTSSETFNPIDEAQSIKDQVVVDVNPPAEPETGDTEIGDTETGDTTTGETETGDTETGDTETGGTTTGGTTTGGTTTGGTTTGGTTTGGTTTPTTYSWSTGAWGTCSGSCGTDNATQTRTVTCVASTGGSVIDATCSASKPATSQACTASACAPTNSAPVITSSATVSVDGNDDTALTITATDADADTLTYSIDGGDAMDFNIDASTGVVTFMDAPNNFTPLFPGDEPKSSYTFTATVSDGSLSDTQSVTINVSKIAIENFTASIDENVAIGTAVGNITITSVGDSNITAFTLSDTTNFEINASGYIKTKTTLDYETKAVYNLQVNATNAQGTSADKTVTININNIVETPSIENFTASIDENVAIGTAVGNITITSVGDSDIAVFTLSETTNFEVNASGYIKTKTTLDYETQNVYNLQVTATNAQGTSADKTVTINISNINEAPTIDTAFADINLVENNGTTSYDLNVSDAEGDSLTVTVESSDTSIITATPNWSGDVLQANYNTLNFNLTTETNATGVAKVTIVVDDGEVNATSSFDVNVLITHNGIEYNTVISPFTSKVWLDRNLGASQVCTAFDDTACYGDYYQWGRDADGHEKLSSALTTTLATDVNNAGTAFITNDSDPYDWVASGVDDNGSLRSANWSKTDGTSVCPVGFRVPTITELAAETTAASTAVENNTQAFDNFLKLPSAGYRRDGTLFEQDTTGTISSTERNPDKSLGFNSAAAALGIGDNPTIARSVRCVKD